MCLLGPKGRGLSGGDASESRDVSVKMVLGQPDASISPIPTVLSDRALRGCRGYLTCSGGRMTGVAHRSFHRLDGGGRSACDTKIDQVVCNRISRAPIHYGGTREAVIAEQQITGIRVQHIRSESSDKRDFFGKCCMESPVVLVVVSADLKPLFTDIRDGQRNRERQ